MLMMTCLLCSTPPSLWHHILFFIIVDHLAQWVGLWSWSCEARCVCNWVLKTCSHKIFVWNIEMSQLARNVCMKYFFQNREICFVSQCASCKNSVKLKLDQMYPQLILCKFQKYTCKTWPNILKITKSFEQLNTLSLPLHSSATDLSSWRIQIFEGGKWYIVRIKNIIQYFFVQIQILVSYQSGILWASSPSLSERPLSTGVRSLNLKICKICEKLNFDLDLILVSFNFPLGWGRLTWTDLR